MQGFTLKAKLREQRNHLIAKMREFIDKADTEKRELTPDERQQIERLEAKIDELERKLDGTEERMGDEDEEERADGDVEISIDDDDDEDDEDGYMDRLRSRLKARDKWGKRRQGRRIPSLAGRLSNDEHRAMFDRFLRHGWEGLSRRDLQAGDYVQGGYLIAPQQFVDDYIIFVNDNVFIREHATIHTLTQARSMGVPSVDTDISDSDWTTELDTGNVDTSLAFGKRELTPWPVAKRIKVSNELMALAPKAESIVQDRYNYKMGVTQEKAFLTGNGAQKPLGIFTASDNGLPTSRDVTASGSTTFDADDLIDCIYNLKMQYQDAASTRWIMHRDVLKVVRKLKDGEGQYLYRTDWNSLDGKRMDRIYDIPVIMSEFAPNTLTSGNYVAFLGDLSFYHICEAPALTAFQRLNELYAETNQTGFIGRTYVDGMWVLAEAGTRLKLA